MLKPSSGILLVLAAAVMWSTGGLVIKSVPADGTVMAATRCLIAGLMLAPFLRRRRVRWSWQVAALLLAYPLMSVCFVLANKWTTAMNAVAIQYAAPLWIFLAQAGLRIIAPTPRRPARRILIDLGIGL
jgi:drug/metabolite transporter (DMT)-like permease